MKAYGCVYRIQNIEFSRISLIRPFLDCALHIQPFDVQHSKHSHYDSVDKMRYHKVCLGDLTVVPVVSGNPKEVGLYHVRQKQMKARVQLRV